MAYGLPVIALRAFAEGERFTYMDRLEQYLRNRQDDSKRHDWDGNLRSLGEVMFNPIKAGWNVPLSDRRPNARYNLPRIIVSNLTQMSLGGTSFPEINCDKDDAAEKALREWSKIMRLPARMAEARNFGGAEGTACLSLGVRNGRFRCDVHNPKHVTVLAWADREEFIPQSVIKAYSFTRDEVDTDNGKMVTRTYWHVRTWDTQREQLWNAIPEEIAKTLEWVNLRPDFEADHGFGFCPFYWCQNLPDSQELDGEGDYEGLEDKFDEINALLSTTAKGTRKNVDPTLLIQEVDNEETVQKGSGAVIYAPGGAKYLEISGSSTETALALLNELRQSALEEVQVVIPREDKITGAAQSAAAMRILFRPMIARCNTLRDQYGPMLERLLTDLLRIARRVRSMKPREVIAPDGSLVPVKDVITPDLDPGETELVTLRWPEYFAPTSQDIKDSVTTAKDASGGKPLISQRTAVDFTSRLFGVVDLDTEMAAIEEDAEADADRAGEQLEREAKVFADAKTGAKPVEAAE